jgi:hypothetical protein
VFRKPLFINQLYHIYACYTKYHVIFRVRYGVQYYMPFNVNVVDLGTYYSWIQGHTCTSILLHQPITTVDIDDPTIILISVTIIYILYISCTTASTLC